MQIKIINVEKAKGVSKGGKQYDYIDVTYKEGDKTASKKLFMNDPIGVKVLGFKNGDFVEMTQTKNGDFWEWTSVALSTPQDIVNSAPAGSATGAVVGAARQQSTYVPDDQKQLLIVRQNCVGNAVKFAEGDNRDVHQMFEIAKLMEDFVYGRYIPPKDQKEGFADLENNDIFDSGVDDYIPS